MRRLMIEDAPARELIDPIWSTGDPETLRSFIRARLDWHGYPLIHDGLVTYSIFDDLVIEAFPEVLSTRIFDYLLSTVTDRLSDTELSAWIFLLYALRKKRPVTSLADGRAIIDALMSVEDRVRDLREKDGNLSYWFYELHNFLLFEVVRHVTYEEYTGTETCPADCESRIQASYKGTLRFEKCLSYRNAIYWIWRCERNPGTPACIPIYLRAVVKEASGVCKCYGYRLPPEFNVPAEAIVTRIEGTELQFGELHEIN